MKRYLRPHCLEDALHALAGPLMVLACGTVFYPACVGGAIDEDVFDITAIPKLSIMSHRRWRN